MHTCSVLDNYNATGCFIAITKNRKQKGLSKMHVLNYFYFHTKYLSRQKNS